MWDRPHLVTDAVADLIWGVAERNREVVRLSAGRVNTNTDDSTQKLTYGWLTTTLSLLRGRTTGDSVWQKTATPIEFKRALKAYLVDEANAIVARGSYQVFERLAWNMLISHALERSLGVQLARDVADICRWLAAGIHLLVGQPGRVLVGTRGGVPAWKTIDPIKLHEMRRAIETIHLMLAGIIESVGPEDTWLVPDFRTHDQTAVADGMGTELHSRNQQLIQSALENQRYTIHPGGVHVKVTGAGHITSLTLKARPAANALVDILAYVQTKRGGYFTVLSEARLLGPDTSPLPFPCLAGPDAAVICQIYHDLVTVREVEQTGSGRQAGIVSPVGEALRGTTLSWTAIPRRVRSGRKHSDDPPVRTPVPTPLIAEPHYVTGHPRQGNMTPRQLAAIQEFEAKTGFDILRHVPAGHTYVLPHFNPHPTDKEWNSLPRYVRHRLGAAITGALVKGQRG